MAVRRDSLGQEEDEEDLFQEGDLIDDKFKVTKKLGRGGYGEIYAVKMLKTGDSVAVKVERVDKPGNLLEEETILRSLKGCKYVPHVSYSGRHEDRVNYIVMELLGDNLSIVRRRQSTHHFSLLSTLMLGMQMLRAVKEVHDAGYIHRDIKPGNFVMGTEKTGTERTVIMIDYGLSRKHLKVDGSVKPKRKTARWVGSRRYMSLNTHFRKDQGRRDDLWSLLYVLIEFLTGTLPWASLRGLANLDKVRDTKMQYNNEKLVRGLPEEFMKFMNHIKTLKYETRPDYDLLHDLLSSLFERNGGTNTTPFDWESEENIGKVLTGSKEDSNPTEKKKSSESDNTSSSSKGSSSKVEAPSAGEEGDRDDTEVKSKSKGRKARCIIL